MTEMNLDDKMEFLVRLKLKSLHRENLPTLTYQQLLKALTDVKWQSGKPERLCKISEDIFSITVEDIVQSFSANQPKDLREALAKYTQ